MTDNNRQRDPYATPPAPKSKSGPVLRFVIAAGLLGAAAWGFMSAPQDNETALAPPATEGQQFAEAPSDTAYEVSRAQLPGETEAPAETAPIRD